MQNLSPEIREGKTLNVLGSLLLRKIFVSKGEEVRGMVRRIMRSFVFCTPNNYYNSSDRIEKEKMVGARCLYGTEGERGDVLV
jgi:hypothetical protein